MTIFGAQYYRPPNPPREDWARDLGRMRDAGLNTVKLWACWSWMEPRRGDCDFADLDRLMDLAHTTGLRVVVNIILENAPYWLEAEVPDARYTDEAGQPFFLTAAMNTPGGGWPGLCFDHERVREAAGTFVKSLVCRYRGHPGLLSWDVWNEPHLEPTSYQPGRLYCYCPASLLRFRRWLRVRYASLDALNDAWARRYSDWAEVHPPRRYEAVPDMLDWRESWFENLTEWLEWRVALVRGADPDHPVMTHVALSGFTGQLATHTLDEFTLGTRVDVFGTSSFPTWLMGDDLAEHLFNLEAARDAAAGRPFWQAEIQGGRGRRDAEHPTGQPRPESMTLWMWNALAAGAVGIIYWQWRPELLGPESAGYGLCTPAGDPTPRLDAVSAFSRIAGRAEIVDRVPTAPTVGILVSRRTALLVYAMDRSIDLYRDAVLGAYHLLLDLDVPAQLVHEDQLVADGVPPHVDHLYWPMPTVASREVADALCGFVARGGLLVAEGLPGEYGPSGQRRSLAPGAGLEALFGFKEYEADIVASGIRVGDSLTLEGAFSRVYVVPLSASVAGWFDDGAPGLTRHVYGAGVAVHIGTYPSVAYARNASAQTRTVMGSVLELGRVRRAIEWVEPQPGLIGRSAVATDGRSVVFAINWIDQAAMARSPVSGTLVAIDGGDVPVEEGAEVVVPASSALLFVGSSRSRADP